MDETIYNNQGPEGFATPPGHNKKTLGIVIVLVVVVVAVAAGIYWFLNQGTEPPIANVNNNVVNQPIDQGAIEKQKEAEEKSKAMGKIFLEPASQETRVGEEFGVSILMNTDGYDISAGGVELKFDSTKLEAKEIVTNGTVLSIMATKSLEPGKVTLVQGQPGDGNWKDKDDGFNGEKGLLAKVIFKAKAAGQVEIGFNKEESKLIFDDAKGTALKTEYGIATCTIK